MPAASLSHGFVFVKHLGPMVRFYEGAFGAGVARHSLPPPIGNQICLTQPPRWRGDTACKLCFAADMTLNDPVHPQGSAR